MYVCLWREIESQDKMSLLLLLWIWIELVGTRNISDAFSLTPSSSHHNTKTNNNNNNNNYYDYKEEKEKEVKAEEEEEEEDSIVKKNHHRRVFLQRLYSSSVGIGTLSWWTKDVAAHAVVMDNTQQTVFQVGKDLSNDQAKARIQEGISSLEYLVSHYDEICLGGGDNVRRYLGTVGTTSGLFGIQKVMKVLQETEKAAIDNIVEYTETMDEVNAAINGADGSAYMAIFVTTSTSQTPPQKYFDDGKIEAQRALKALQDLSQLLQLQ